MNLVDGDRTRWNLATPSTPSAPSPRAAPNATRQQTLTRVSELVRDMTALQRQLDTPPRLAKRIQPGLDGP